MITFFGRVLIRQDEFQRLLAVEEGLRLRRDELEFVRVRASRSFDSQTVGFGRCHGISSDALARFAIGGPEPTGWDYPYDTDDLNACERTFEMGPAHLQVRMLPVLEKYRARIVERQRESDEARDKAFTCDLCGKPFATAWPSWTRKRAAHQRTKACKAGRL
jgi:hypothetical protein